VAAASVARYHRDVTRPPPERLAALAMATLALAASCFVLASYLFDAGALVAYPWDWSPDEGLQLDWGRRAAVGLRELYGRSTVPFPAVYGPGLPLLLAPLAPLGPAMLQAARLLAVAWTALGAFAVFRLVRPAAGRIAALVAVALALAPFDYSFWSMLVRPDGPMLALWLLAAATLLPPRLARGADTLGWRRIALGSTLILAAVVTKPTVVIHAAPLVLGWLAVDRRSALRLGLALAGGGALLLLLLQWLTAGSFLWLTRAWALQATEAGLALLILKHAGSSLWPLVAFAATALVVAWERRGELLRDGSLLLVAGAALIMPFLDKHGASWNYMLPFVPALSVLAIRWWALALPPPVHARGLRLALAAGALLALVLARTHAFPLPSALDERTARAFYGFVVEHTKRSGGPILATRPELAYFLVGQPVEMEGASFAPLARHHIPGPELVLQRLRERRYTLIVELHPLPDGGWAEAAAQGYRHAGGCNLSFYFGTTPVHLFTRRDLPLFMSPPAGTRCGGPAAAAAPAGS
jgi:hypothetical protein